MNTENSKSKLDELNAKVVQWFQDHDKEVRIVTTTLAIVMSLAFCLTSMRLRETEHRLEYCQTIARDVVPADLAEKLDYTSEHLKNTKYISPTWETIATGQTLQIALWQIAYPTAKRLGPFSTARQDFVKSITKHGITPAIANINVIPLDMTNYTERINTMRRNGLYPIEFNQVEN